MNNIILLGHGVGIKLIVETLENNASTYKVCGVVTHPLPDHRHDLEMLKKRKGYYTGYGYNVFDVKKDYNIDLLESQDVNNPETAQWVEQYNPKYIISIGCRNIIKKSFLDKFPNRVLNIHTTPLPRYRGGANDTWMILNGETDRLQYGCVHLVDEHIDTGDIIAKVFYKIPTNIYPIDLFKIRMNTLPELITLALNNLESPHLKPEKQSVDEGTTFPRLHSARDGRIDFQKFTGESLLKFIYAFGYPFEGAFCFLGEKKINILEAEFYTDKIFHPFADGLIFGKNEKNEYKVSIRGGYLLIKKIELDGLPVEQNQIFRLGRILS